VWTLENKFPIHVKDINFESVGETPYTLVAIEEQDTIILTSRSRYLGFLNVNDGKFSKKATQLKDAVGIAILKATGKIIVADNQSNRLTAFSF